jgi:hypothetical protein
MDTIHVSNTAKNKSERYLSAKQLRDVIYCEEGYICRKTSPNHEGLYDDNKFIMRGRFYDTNIDIVFVVGDKDITVITQMSQHTNSLQGRYYQEIGNSVEDAISYLGD